MICIKDVDSITQCDLIQMIDIMYIVVIVLTSPIKCDMTYDKSHWSDCGGKEEIWYIQGPGIDWHD